MLGNAVAGRICSIEGNSHCADCSSRSPRWASVNLGVLLCINCSGVHRKLGVHLSNVKSLTLDNLRPEWIKVLTSIGNDVANKYYLHRLPLHAARPNPNTPPRDMEVWIRNKYERKIYAMTALDEPHQLLANGYNPRDAVMKAVGGGHAPPTGPQQVTSTLNSSKESTSTPFYDFDSNRPIAPTNQEDLFGNANATNNPPFDAFGNDASAASWGGDFWPTEPRNKTAVSGSNTNPERVSTVASGSYMGSGKAMETRIEAAKDSISKLFDNPAQIGFKGSSYQQTTPNCVKGDLLDFNFSDLGNRLQEQRNHHDDII